MAIYRIITVPLTDSNIIHGIQRQDSAGKSRSSSSLSTLSKIATAEELLSSESDEVP